MTPSDVAYFEDLMVHLRMQGVSGRLIGEAIEEAMDHVRVSGEAPEEAFGPSEVYAREVALSLGKTGVAAQLTLLDLVFGAVLIVGWWGLLAGVLAWSANGNVELRPGYILGVAIVAAGLPWPVWATFESFLRDRSTAVRPALVLIAIISGASLAALVWREPVLVELSPPLVIGASFLAIASGAIRAWKLRDPLRRPTNP